MEVGERGDSSMAVCSSSVCTNQQDAQDTSELVQSANAPVAARIY